MNKLFDFGNRYAKESTWKDFALVKFCLFSMGLAAGTQISAKHKKKQPEQQHAYLQQHTSRL